MKSIILFTLTLISLSCIGQEPNPIDSIDSAPIKETDLDGGVGGGAETNPKQKLEQYLQEKLGIGVGDLPPDGSLRVGAMTDENGKRVLALNTQNTKIRVFLDKDTGRPSLRNLNFNPPKIIYADDFEGDMASKFNLGQNINNQIKGIYAGWQSGPNRNSFPPIAQLAFQHLSQLRERGGSQARSDVPPGGAQTVNPSTSSGSDRPPGHAGNRTTANPPKGGRPENNTTASQFKEWADKFEDKSSIGADKKDLTKLATQAPTKKDETNFTEQGPIEMKCIIILEDGKEQEVPMTFFISKKVTKVG